ncbi:MAG: flavin reductase family protein [Hyphomonadaceae bacterium]
MADLDLTPGGFDPKAYRSALGGFGTGVALVAARDEQGRAHGLIINSLTSVSLSPPIMLWCLANSSKAFDVFTRADTFSLNILRSDDHDVAHRFSRSGDRIIPEDQVCTMETGRRSCPPPSPASTAACASASLWETMK